MAVKVFDKVLNKEVLVQELITPDIGIEIAHECLKPDIEVDVADIKEDEPQQQDVTDSFLKATIGLRCRALQSDSAQITQTFHYKDAYDSHGQWWDYYHGGIDLVRAYSQLDYATAHSAGIVDGIRTNCTGFEDGGSYGNYVLIKHANGYHTRYAHLAYGTIKVSVGQTVSKGQVLGYLDNTGTSYGGHLHFEVIDTGWNRIDPEPFLNANLPHIVTKEWVKIPVWLLKDTETGSWLKGWQEVNGKWYYLDPADGIMKTGWWYDPQYKGWFYLDPTNGDMQTGWVKVKGKWYFLARTTTGSDVKGKMKTGWLKDKNKWYYLNPKATSQYKEGEMFTGTHIIDGKTYYFDNNGALINS